MNATEITKTKIVLSRVTSFPVEFKRECCWWSEIEQEDASLCSSRHKIRSARRLGHFILMQLCISDGNKLTVAAGLVYL